MIILIVSLPILAIIYLANVLDARGSAKARTIFNLVLFVISLFMVIAGLILRFAATDLFTSAELGLQVMDMRMGAVPLIGIGLWGMLVSLKPFRVALARVLPALRPESPVHTLALAAVGYLMGNAALSMAPGALDALAESGIEASLVDVLAQQFAFVLAAFVGVGLLSRRDSGALNERLGLMRPTARQLWTGVIWMIFFVFLQGCITITWALFQPSEVEQLSGINEALLGNFDTVWEWFLLAAAAGLGEELLFRGALQPVFGIIPTSIIFAVAHVQYGLTPATLAIFLLSVVLGIIRKRSNTTVAILVHAGYNFILGLLSLLAVYLEPFMRQFTP